ncbi:MAG: methyltransferase domain-containing protein [Actinobacteria bacterium]|nr:methyltransferase domain-containing protein [Actinomycetota bacterium]
MAAPTFRDRAPVEHFERLARESEDPWGYETSEYEQRKYRHTLEFLPERTGRTLELGCSIGVFTAMLAPRTSCLLAVDFSPTALERARRRLRRSRHHVQLLRRSLPEEMPAGPFDTIVCAETLYYWSEPLVRLGLQRMEAALAPGGTLLVVSWRHPDRRRRLTGDDVHAIIDAETRLAPVARFATDDYLLDRRVARW